MLKTVPSTKSTLLVFFYISLLSTSGSSFYSSWFISHILSFIKLFLIFPTGDALSFHQPSTHCVCIVLTALHFTLCSQNVYTFLLLTLPDYKLLNSIFLPFTPTGMPNDLAH